MTNTTKSTTLEQKRRAYKIFAIVASAIIVLLMLAVIFCVAHYIDETSLISRHYALLVLISAIVCIFVMMVFGIAGIAFSNIAIRMERDNDAAVKAKERENAENLEIIQTLSTNFNAVYYIDLETGDVKFLQIGQRIGIYMGEEYSEKKSFEEYARAYAEKLVYPEYRDQFIKEVTKENLSVKLANNSYYTYHYIGDKNGNPNYFEMKAARVHGSKTKLVVGFADVDAEIKKEQADKVKIEDALGKAEKAGEVKSTFLANVSHELRTPLNAIAGFNKLAEWEAREAGLNVDYYARIDMSITQMQYLVESILDTCNYDSEEIELVEEECTLSELIGTLVTVNNSAAQAKKVQLRYELTDAKANRVFADKAKLTRALANIVGNAINYNRPGGEVVLRIYEGDVEDGRVTVSFHIIDNGLGMSEAFKAKMFEPFSRERSSTETGISGSGLGLTISKQILDAMGATIEVNTEEDLGTTVTVTATFRIVA